MSSSLFLSRAALALAVAVAVTAAVADARTTLPIEKVPRLRSAAPSPSHQTFPLAGSLYSTGDYIVSVEIGTPAKTFRLLLDTGSSNIAVAAPSCPTCGSWGSRYDIANSTSAEPVLCGSAACNKCTVSGSGECLFGQPYCALEDADLCGTGISYGGGSSYISGHLVTDVVALGPFSAPNVSVVVMDNTYPTASFNSAPNEGIFGLAYADNACNPTCVTPAVSAIVAHNDMDDIFGLCLNLVIGGTLDLGYVDTARMAGPPLWLPVTQHRWYDLPLVDVKVDSVSIGLPPFVYSYTNDQIGSFIDSGTGVFLLGPQAYASFVDTFQANFCSVPGVCGNSTVFSGKCLTLEEVEAFPTLNLMFNDGTSTLRSLPFVPKAYFVPEGAPSPLYCLGIQGVPGVSAVLGDTFLSQFYTIHDRMNNRVGFAPLADGAC